MEKKEDLFLLKQQRLNWILMLLIFLIFVEKNLKQLLQRKMEISTHLDT